MSLDPAAVRFRDLVRERTAGTPYVVLDTEAGFDLTTDVADLRWAGLLGSSGVRKVYVHHVAFPQPSVFTVTDDSRSLTWGSQGPVLGADYNRSVGRVVQKGSFSSWGFRPDGSFGVTQSYRFDSEEGRSLIRVVGEELGFTERMGSAQRLGLIAAGAAIGGVALMALVAVLLKLLLG